MSTEMIVADATCGHCKQTIETTVLALDGVDNATLDLDSKRLTVEHGAPLDPTVLTGAIEEAGYTPELVS